MTVHNETVGMVFGGTACRFRRSRELALLGVRFELFSGFSLTRFWEFL